MPIERASERAGGRAERRAQRGICLSASGERRRRRHERGHSLYRQQDQPHLQGGDPLRGHPLHHRHRELHGSSRQRYGGAGLGLGERGPGTRRPSRSSFSGEAASSLPVPPATRARPGRGLSRLPGPLPSPELRAFHPGNSGNECAAPGAGRS